ncbi:MAG TPA: M20/M25/M40 family metallo-hydrolase [Hyphomonadaceae bacterium]|nr:M20/M25/M40 family metallo-hydrolase [Hyphomonadaceae bacterium]
MRTSLLFGASLVAAVLAAACATPQPAADAQAGQPANSAAIAAANAQAAQGEPEFRALYTELIEINTTLSVGSCTKAAEAMKVRLSAAGYADSDMHLITDPKRPQDGNLIALLPGTDGSLKPLLLLAHIDVVEANRADWVRDPFKLTEEGGFFYARGASDDKAMAAIFTDSMVRFKKEGYHPTRGVKLMLTCGEESPNTFNGVKYLVANYRQLIDAQFALNEGAGGRLDLDTGKYIFNGVQAGEKLYQDYTLEVTNPGGHSSRPVPDNAIYRLGAALLKVSQLEFPIEFNDATKGYFLKMADLTPGQEGQDMKAAATTQDAAAIARLKANPSNNSILHTTCVATQLSGGHAPNALPQRATANVNCRIFPGHSPEEIRKQIETAVGDKEVKVTLQAEPETPSPPPPLTPAIMGPIEKLTKEMFPGVPVIPAMAAGATDGRFLTPIGIPTYGVSGIFADPATTGAHGLNERVPVKSLMEGRAFLYRLAKEYAGGK